MTCLVDRIMERGAGQYTFDGLMSFFGDASELVGASRKYLAKSRLWFKLVNGGEICLCSVPVGCIAPAQEKELTAKSKR